MSVTLVMVSNLCNCINVNNPCNGSYVSNPCNGSYISNPRNGSNVSKSATYSYTDPRCTLTGGFRERGDQNNNAREKNWPRTFFGPRPLH